MAFDDLYQEIILDHYRNPRNTADLSFISEENIHENPSCGDTVKLHAVVEDDTIRKVEFEGHGCAISVASASMMSELTARPVLNTPSDSSTTVTSPSASRPPGIAPTL